MTAAASIPTLNSAHSIEVINGIVKFAKPAVYSVESGITAAAGGGQTNAYQLSAEYNIVVTVGTAADSVKLPELSASLIGKRCVVANNHATLAIAIFPFLGQDASTGTNTTVPLAALSRQEFIAVSASACTLHVPYTQIYSVNLYKKQDNYFITEHIHWTYIYSFLIC